MAPRGRWTPSDDNLASEAHAVLIRREKASRTYPRARLLEALASPGVRTQFLKLCLEWDDTRDLSKFRRGLLFAVRASRPSQLAKRSGLSRVTLYRMLGAGGNPRLSSLVPLLRELGLFLWVVDKEFIQKRTRLRRPKNELPADSAAEALARRRLMEYPRKRGERYPEEIED